jgi:DNA-binding MarR family transcriptional regulator
MHADETATREARTKGPVRFDDIAGSWRREQPDLAMDDLLLSICLTRLGRMLDARYHRRCQERFGISGADLRVLLALRRAGRPYARRPTDLFRALIVTSGAITKQVDRLLAKGLVARMQDPLHDGGFLVHLTAKGLKLVNIALEDLAGDATLAGAMAQLSPREREAGIRFCAHLIRQLEQQPSD